MRLDPAALITEKEQWGEYFMLTFESPDMARDAAPGMFLMVKVAPGPHPPLRRPFSIHDRERGLIRLFFKVAGEGTKLLSEKQPGDRLDVIGPLGKGFNLELGLNTDSASRSPVLAVGGGRGIAPLVFLAKELGKIGRPVNILYGGRSVVDIPLKDRREAGRASIICSTDDGSFGFKGLVTELLQKELKTSPAAALYACGPEPMLKAVDRMAEAAGLPVELSLEARMGCGFGACWGCIHRIRGDGQEAWVKICEEGPVFAGGRVVWPEET